MHISMYSTNSSTSQEKSSCRVYSKICACSRRLMVMPLIVTPFEAVLLTTGEGCIARFSAADVDFF